MAKFGQGGPDQETGIYTSGDGSLQIRFDTLQRKNRKISPRDLKRGFLSFRADRMLFIVFKEKGELNVTDCIRFVQTKRGKIVAKDRDLKPRLLGVRQRNPLSENWTIDDVDGDRQLGTTRRRDGVLSTSTCDTPGTRRPLRYLANISYRVEFMLYVVNCCGPPAKEEKPRKGKKKKKDGNGDAAPTRQILFAQPWEIEIFGQVRTGILQARARYSQKLGTVEVAPPDGSLTPVVPSILTDARICRPIRLRRGDSPCR